MWDLPRPGLEPVSPALAGGFLTTAPPRKPYAFVFVENLFILILTKQNLKGKVDSILLERMLANMCSTPGNGSEENLLRRKTLQPPLS